MNPFADYFETLAINVGIGAIVTGVDDPKIAPQLKAKLGTLVDAICTAYGWTVTRS